MLTPSQIASILTPIAQTFEIFECREAARALSRQMTNLGQPNRFVNIGFSGRGIVQVDINGRPVDVSLNGFHVGVQVGGLVFCNIVTTGLPLRDWLDSFHGVGEGSFLIDREIVYDVNVIMNRGVLFRDSQGNFRF